MAVKIGVVGHKNTLNLVAEVVEEYFDDVELYPIEFSSDDNIENVIGPLKTAMQVCDGMLYSRYESYSIVSKHVTHTVPARFVEINSSNLVASMLKGVIEYGIKPESLSIDSLDYKTALNACHSVGLNEKDVELNTFLVDLRTEGFVRETLAKHIENYNAGASLCITNISAVAVELKKMNIPSEVLVPEKESFVREIRHLMLQHELRIGKSKDLAFIEVSLKYKEKFRFYRDMPLREMDEIANTGKILTLFADQIDGICIQKSAMEFIIIGEGRILKQITEEFINISVMQKIVNETAFEVKMGVGLGESVKSAYSNSNMAFTHSDNYIGSNTYVMYDNSKIWGPVTPVSSSKTPDSDIDDKLFKIATESDIGFNTINKLYQVSHTRSVSLFTSQEIAELLGVTRRTSNRLIEKLIDSGYACISGSSIMSQKGRPSRVIKLMF